jgi:hypothetical protein
MRMRVRRRKRKRVRNPGELSLRKVKRPLAVAASMRTERRSVNPHRN